MGALELADGRTDGRMEQVVVAAAVATLIV